MISKFKRDEIKLYIRILLINVLTQWLTELIPVHEKIFIIEGNQVKLRIRIQPIFPSTSNFLPINIYDEEDA